MSMRLHHLPFIDLASLGLFFKLCLALLISMLVGTVRQDWDIYHSPWFIGLLCLLALNTVACVASRWKSVPWPSLVSHLGILCILGGGATSLALGQGGQMALDEHGPAQSEAVVDDGGGRLKLPFSVRLKKFEIEYYGQEGGSTDNPAVRQFKSSVQFLDFSGATIADEVLWVNRPFRIGGYSFYQASFDRDNPSISVLSVRKDPGTAFVYLGFAVLVCGLGWNAFRRLA